MEQNFDVEKRFSYKLKQDLTTHASELVVFRFDFSQVKLFGCDYSPTQDTLPISFGFSSRELFRTSTEQEESRNTTDIEEYQNTFDIRLQDKDKQKKLESKMEEMPREYVYSELFVGRLDPAGYMVDKFDLDDFCIVPSVEPNTIYYEKRLLYQGTMAEVAAKNFLERSAGKITHQGFGKFRMPIVPESALKNVERVRDGYRFYKTDLHYNDDFFGWTHCQGKILDIVIGNEIALRYMADVIGNHGLLDLPMTSSVERISDLLTKDSIFESEEDNEENNE